MKVLIFGAGSIGVYLGTLLYSRNNDVLLLGRKKLKKIRDVILIGDKSYKLPRRTYSMPKNKKFDFIFLTSKLYDLQNNLKLIHKNNLHSKYLISIQNGITDEDLYNPYIKNFKFTSISIFEGFRLTENQLITSHSKIGWKTDTSEAGKATSKLLLSAGINCKSDVNFNSIRAEKTIMNCSVNLLSAIKKKTFYELFFGADTRKIVDSLFEESYNVLSRLYKLKSKEKLKKEFYDLASKMKHYSSTYQDAISKRKSEAEFLNGLIIKLGEKISLPTPQNRVILKEFYKKYPNSK